MASHRRGGQMDFASRNIWVENSVSRWSLVFPVPVSRPWTAIPAGDVLGCVCGASARARL
eukprot:1642262-Lingulodinium_polyedra.AAC.1